MASEKTHVILGDGIAGMSAAQFIRTRCPDDRIVIISNDPQPFYYRAALTNYLSGALSNEELWAMPPHHWGQLKFERKYGFVSQVDAKRQTIEMSDGERLSYDRLLIATGCRARRLETREVDPQRGVVGANLKGVQVMRTLNDTHRIVEQIGQVGQTQNAVVLGGGILGVEVCHGLHSRHVNVTFVHHKPWLLDRVVDRRAGELIAKRMRRSGIDVRTGNGIGAIQGSHAGIESVLLNNGRSIPCSMLVTCIGNQPNTGWLADSGVELEGGYIPVNRQMKVAGTDNIWAAGDVTRFTDAQLPFPNAGGLWQPAKKQGQIAGRGMVKSMEIADYGYFPGAIYNATKTWDLDLGTLGHHVDQPGETVVFNSVSDSVPIYKKLVLKKSDEGHLHIVGAMLLGDRREGHAIKHLMNLRGAAGDVTSIKDRIFDVTFDLAAWVAFRQNQPDVEKYQQTGVTSICPIPPSLVKGQRETKQKDMARVTPMVTSLAVSRIDSSIRLRIDDDDRQVLKFNQRAVRIGARADYDIVVSDVEKSQTLMLSREGLTWVASTDARRGSLATLNGRELDREITVRDGDVLQLGAWKAVVQLDGQEEAEAQQPSAISAVLMINDDPYPVREDVTMLGTSIDSDIVLNDPAVSLHHAQIHRRGNPYEYLLMDFASRTGTFVDGKQVFAPMKIRSGQEIRLGNTILFLDTLAEKTKARLSLIHAAEESELERSAINLEACSALAKSTQSSQQVAESCDTVIQSAGHTIFVTEEMGVQRGKSHRLVLPATIGRSSKAGLTIKDTLLSREHVRLEKSGAGYFITDLGSLNGVLVQGNRLPPNEAHALSPGDSIEIGRSVLRFNDWEHQEPARGNAAGESTGSTATNANAFQIDFVSTGDPLTADLRKTVRDEMDACIGCHECMRACPLPEADMVTIGALNSYGAGSGSPAEMTLDFVDHCTQCQACVPVCPVDIQRSRIVLWNQLKTPPDANKRIRMQMGDQQIEVEATVGLVAEQFSEHPILGCLFENQRLQLCSDARYRSLRHHEQLVQEGTYLDAVWFVIEGDLEIGMATEQMPFQPMVTLNSGQCVGEDSVLVDQPIDVSARSVGETIVMGLSKYALKSQMKRPENSEFKRRFEMLYANRSVQAFFRKQAVLDEVSDEVINEIVQEFKPERYLPGKLVLNETESHSQIGVVKRGFVKEIREREGAEIVSNYLQVGDAFGAIESVDAGDGTAFNQRGRLLRYEAGTAAEVLTADIKQLRTRFPMFSSLIESRWVSRLSASGSDQTSPCESGFMTLAAAEGVLQAKQLLVINTGTCVDCDNCVSACERRHGVPRLDRSGTGRQIGQYQIPASCFHCEDPVCLYCSVDGIVREPTGEIRIVEDNCIGCRGCAERCPYDNIQMVPRNSNNLLMTKVLPTSWTEFLGLKKSVKELADIDTVAVKCDLCHGYDGLPACVRSCPTGAAERVDPIEHFMNLTDKLSETRKTDGA